MKIETTCRIKNQITGNLNFNLQIKGPNSIIWTTCEPESKQSTNLINYIPRKHNTIQSKMNAPIISIAFKHKLSYI